MKYDHIGMSFLKIAAFLFAARYVAAGAYMGGSSQGMSSAAFFNAGYTYVGSDLTVAAAITAVLGIAALAFGFLKK
jgi:hypothetical protein